MMKISNEMRLAAMTMMAGFAVTFAYLWWQRGPGLPDPPVTLPSHPTRTYVANPPPRLPPPSHAPAPVEDPKSPAPSAPAVSVPPANVDGPALPILVAITALPSGSTADPEAYGDDTSNQVDILNTSEQLLAVTVIDVNARKQKTASTQVLLAPNGQAHIRNTSGLPLEPGDELTLRSSGFRDQSQSVP